MIKKIFYITIFLFIQQLSAQKQAVVAEFLNEKITLLEFNYAYMDIIKNPKNFDSKEMREEFLDKLIESRLLARNAGKNLSEDDLFTKYKIKAYQNKSIRDIHYLNAIKPKIKITEKDIEDAYQFTQEERRISHLFFKNKKSADSVYNLLLKGESFETNAKAVFKDSALAQSGGDLGWVYWDQLEMDLAENAFKTKTGEFSKPVKSHFGYHIIKVTDFKKKPLITRQEYVVHRRKAAMLLEFKIGEKLSDEYIDKLLGKAKITIYPEVLKVVDESLTGKFKRKPAQFDQMREFQLNDQEIKTVENNLWEFKDETIATVNGKNLKVIDFIGALTYIPYDVIYSGFKNTFDFVIRNFLINIDAEKKYLHKEPSVKVKTNIFMDYLLSQKIKQNLLTSVNPSENETEEYYNINRDKFGNSSYSSVKEYVKEKLKEDKRRNVVKEYITKKYAGLKINKNLSIINEYYDNIQSRKNN